MTDARHELLARQLIDYSIELQAGEVLYLEVKGHAALALAKPLVRLATERGAVPFLYYSDESVMRHWIAGASEAQHQLHAELHLDLMKRAAAYIGLRGSDNPFDLADVSPAAMERMSRHFFKPVHLEQRVKKTRWVVLRYPNNAMAQLAETSQEAFEEFYFQVCCADYARMSEAEELLKRRMEAADRVRLVGPGTELSFSIKGIPVIKCAGKRNIPDGEVFTAPVRDSINGTIQYNTPSLHQGVVYHDICLSFERGQIVKASCSGDDRKLNEIFDTDEGARYVGEFAVGVNPFIRQPMRDALFDEKIAGSIHLTPGQCYEEAPNGNQSAIHWDLVLIQRADFGGGEMYFDDQLVRKDGIFCDDEVEQAFSAENLRGRV